MKHYKIKKGYDIPVKGMAEKTLENTAMPVLQAVTPSEFQGIKPRLDVKQGDTVEIGTILFHDKQMPQVRFASPASGKVHEIVYGPRRKLERIVISVQDSKAKSYSSYKTSDISSIKKDELVTALLDAGVWPYIRQRPFNKIADPGKSPSSVFVNCMDTAPLAADQAFALQEESENFRAGIEALKVLSGGKVNIVTNKNDTAFQNISGVNYYSFAGKHPAGLVSTHIDKIDPISGHKIIWHLNARDVAMVGSFLLNGKFPVTRVVALTGDGLKKTRYVKTVAGVQLQHIVTDLKTDDQRVISGNLLTGSNQGKDGFLGFYDGQITVIPEGREQYFLGWMAPGFTRPSFSRAFMSALLPGKKYGMDTNQNGEERAFVKTGDYAKVMALDILPEFLAKSVLAGDIEEMENLGILECDPEDFALCSYICPSKIDFMKIIKDGQDMMAKEM